MQVAPTFGDAPGVLRDSRAKAMPPGLHSSGPPSSADGATVTMVFCAPAQYKVLLHALFVPHLSPSSLLPTHGVGGATFLSTSLLPNLTFPFSPSV